MKRKEHLTRRRKKIINIERDASMARTKRELTSDLKKEMNETAKEFVKFRESNVLSQKLLSEIIEVSRRTIQNIEAGRIIPQASTLKKFEDLRKKYEREGKLTGRRKTKKNHHEEGEF